MPNGMSLCPTTGVKSMYKKVTLALIGVLAAVAAATALAADSAPINPAEAPSATDPTVSQVYDAARAGHLDQAKQMMALVLANHPHSARAHYVAAELDADMKNFGEARQELKTAEEITPGLPFARPEEVQALRKEIGAPNATAAAGTQALPMRSVGASPMVARAPVRPIPWGTILVIGAVVVVLWLLFRRRSTPAPMYSAGSPGPMSPPMGGGYPNVVAGGSGIVGGLASGLAVGAGIAAGEELVHHFESNHGEGAVAPAAEPVEGPANSDLGGPDFGINDPGAGWDDGGSSSGGDDGGGDWT
jgi:uncharacterized protein